MKKNISINIGGIIFHIEEDGYEKLQAYLSEINTYFRKYDDNSEIISDIENRIAEIFSQKLGKDKEVITLSDVEQLITTMGTVTDFASMEEGEDIFEESYTSSAKSATGSRKLYRDLKRKMIGGVSAGLAHYFKMDPLWMRIVFLILFFGFLFVPPLTGLTLIVYIALWIAVPGTENLEEDTRVKKFYRDPDDKVIGGVCSGLAAYFGVDVAIIRLIFVLSLLFFGTGLIIYIVLWLIAPTAETMTEKMQMKGDPVTLSNIESSVKKSLNSDPNKEENAFVSILLFPFRLIGKIFEVLGKALGPILLGLGKVLRILIGLFLIVFAFITLLAYLGLTAAGLGLLLSPEFMLEGVPAEVLTSLFPQYAIIAGILAIGIPIIALALLGIRIITLRPQVSSTVAWAMVGVWLISSMITFSAIPGIVTEFNEEGGFVENEIIESNGKTLVLDIKDVDKESFDGVRLTIRPHEDSVILLVKEFQAKGSTEGEAEKNAAMVSYNTVMNDSIYSFDSNLQFKEGAKFRDQRVNMTLYMPLGQKFVMDQSLDEIIYRTIYYYDYRVRDMGENVFVFNNMEDLTCLTCDPRDENGNYSPGSSDFSKEFDVNGDFNSVVIKGIFKVNLSQDSVYHVEVIGRRSKVEDVDFEIDSDGELEIHMDDFDEDFDFRGRTPLYLNISAPDFSEVEVYGNNDFYAKNLDLQDFRFQLSGMGDAEIEGNYEKLEVEIEGLSDVKLSGTAEYLEANVAGKAELDAKNLIVSEADVKSFGNSEVTVNVTNYLTAYAAGVSEVNYYGNPKNVDEKTAGLSGIHRK